MPKFDIKWVNKPPIVEIEDQEEFRVFCSRFMADTTTWMVPPGTEDAAIWNEEVEHEVSIAQLASTWTKANPRYFVYIVLGKPVGLMVTSEKQARSLIKINCLATHIGTKNAGDILIEHAVNLSQQAGYNGRLEISQYAAPAAEAWGFVETDSFRMELVTRESSMWVEVSNEWRLRQYQVRSPLDILTWREITIEAQIGRIVLPRRFFGFLS